MSEVKSFTIDRATWLHGEGADNSYLLRPTDGKMCCLGHYLKAVGIEEEAITSVDTPCQYLIKDNDDTTDSRNEKEYNIIAGFKEVGIDVSFTGSYSK